MLIALFFFFQIISVVSVFFILTSIFSFCLKTHPNCRVPVIHNVAVTLHITGTRQLGLVLRQNKNIVVRMKNTKTMEIIQYWSGVNCIILFLPDNFRGFGVFHPDFDILVLPQDSPQLPGTRDTQCDCGRHLSKHDLLDFGQVTNLSSRGLYIHWTGVQHLVHFRVHHKVLCDSHNTRILQITAQLDRLCGHTQLLFRYAPSGTALNDSHPSSVDRFSETFD